MKEAETEIGVTTVVIENLQSQIVCAYALRFGSSTPFMYT